MKTRLLAISMVLVIIGCGGFVVWYFLLRPGRLDFDKLGGTILVYEIAPNPKNDGPDPDLADKMAKVLQRRLDPDDRGLAVVQSQGKDRVEIRVPKTDDMQAAIDRIKDLVLAVGHLEFLILANEADDGIAIDHAKRLFNSDDDPDFKRQLQDSQEKGTPPPGLREIAAKDLKTFPIKLPKGQQSIVTYRWVELGPQELRTLNLDNAAEADPKRNETWLQAKKSRGQAAQLNEPGAGAARMLMQGALVYSRECKNKNLTDEEREKKAVEYFALARDPEIDPKLSEKLPIAQRRTRTFDGSFITNTSVEKYNPGGLREVGWVAPWFVSFSLNPEGAELLRTLTKKNVPDENKNDERVVKRHLAIILDGQIMSAPTINTEIGGGKGQVSGQFTEPEARRLAAILGGGALPAMLKPVPVSEKEVPPKTK